MKITRIHHLKDYRIFRDFSWPADGLPDFARFNLVYGWNGSGKTALSNLFRHVQIKTPLPDGNVEIVVEQTRVPGSAFASLVLPEIRVFNRDTVSRNVFEAPNEQLPPVFFLGEDSIEKQKRIEELKKEATNLSSTRLRLEGKKSSASNALEAYCTDQARSIKNLLTVAGGGRYNNYDARDLKVAVQRIAAETPQLLPLPVDLRDKHLAAKDGKPLAKLDALSIAYPDFSSLTSRVHATLGQSVLSRVIAELSENPEVASWVADGIGLHTGPNGSERCKFCDQLLPADRLQHLEDHFNDDFKRFQNELDALIADVATARATIDGLRLPAKTLLYSHIQSEYEKATSTLTQQAGLMRVYCNALTNALAAKKHEPFKSLDLLPFFTRSNPVGEPAGTLEKVFQFVIAGTAGFAGVLGKSAYEQVNALIVNHNQYTDNFAEEVSQSRAALAQDEVLKAVEEWRTKTQAVKSTEEALDAARQRTTAIQTEMVALENQVLQHRRPAEELNREMADYLGRDELRFEVEQNGYRISRNGSPATHLSEGERTAIAFMYFLKSLEANDFDLKTGVVVIDDPVSSLDANSLYSAFGFMKQRTANAGQLFVLTCCR